MILRRKVSGSKHFTEAVDLSDPVVGELSVGLGRWCVSTAGGIGNENADMSTDNAGEKPARRKPKVSLRNVNRRRVSRPLRRGRKP